MARADLVRELPALWQRFLQVVRRKGILAAAQRVAARLQRGLHINARLLLRGKQYRRQLEAILRQHSVCSGVVIYPPTVDWTSMKQRPHHLLREMARAGYLVFWCSPQNHSDCVQGFVQLEPNLFLTDSIVPLRSVPEPILLIGATWHRREVANFNQPRIIYDYLDDLTVSAPSGVIDRQKHADHLWLLENATVVCATARALYQEANSLRPDVLYSPNAADYEHFHLDHAPPVPCDLKPILAQSRPIIGYFGALARWVDYRLIVDAASRCPDLSFVFLGPDHDGSLPRDDVSRYPNLHFLGEKKYEELPFYLYYFSVATVPFLVNRITQATSPVKLFEYMSGGAPIVTTALPECRQYRSVMVSVNREQFASNLRRAILLKSDRDYQRLLEQEARQNNWQARAAEMRSVLEREQAGRRAA